MSSWTSLMPTACPAKTRLKLIFFLPRQITGKPVKETPDEEACLNSCFSRGVSGKLPRAEPRGGGEDVGSPTSSLRRGGAAADSFPAEEVRSVVDRRPAAGDACVRRGVCVESKRGRRLHVFLCASRIVCDRSSAIGGGSGRERSRVPGKQTGYSRMARI